jgi:dihydrofolate reductase
MFISLIWAMDKNNGIGFQNQLPWHLPEDLKHFKDTTAKQTVLMGRNTWDSLPNAFKPLPQRKNIVLTRQTSWQAEGAITIHNLLDLKTLLNEQEHLWVIGGANLYKQILPFAHQAVITQIDATFQVDTYAPTLPTQWVKTLEEKHQSKNGIGYSFVHHTNTAVLPLF